MQPAIVYSGALNAGSFELVVRAVVISPASQEPAEAKIRNRIVPPGDTFDADAETVTDGWAGVDECEGDDEGERDDDGDGAGEERCRWPAAHPGEEAAGLPVLLGTGADGETAGLDDRAGLDGVAGVLVASCPGTSVLGAPPGDRVAKADGVAGADAGADVDGVTDGDADGVTEADDATAMTMVVTPPKIRRKPVARISVTGRTCLDRMETPRQSMPWWLRSCCTGYSSRLTAWIAPDHDFLVQDWPGLDHDRPGLDHDRPRTG